MPRPKPTCTITLKFISGKKFRIDLYSFAGGMLGRYFEVKFTNHDGEVRHGNATITRLVNRLRKLLVREI